MKNLAILFEQQVERTPNGLALQHQDRVLTYQDLNQRANQLAHFLRAKGLRPEDKVLICLPRSLEAIISILAVLKSGAAYVPVNTKYPLKRLHYIANDTAAKIIISTARFQAFWEDKEELLLIDDFSFDTSEVDNPISISNEQDLAYVIYTSGSTGTPKGVMVEHRNAIHFTRWAKTAYQLGEKDVVVAFAPFIFDLSIFEIFATLSAGAKLIIANKPYDIFDPQLLEEVTLMSTVPSAFKSLTAFQKFFEENWQLPNLKQFNFAGEKLPLDLVKKVYASLQPDCIYNCYGPTETTTYATVFPIAKDYEGPMYLGPTIDPTTIYILDDTHQELPPDTIGEIYIGGPCVSRGYLNLKAATQERYLDLPGFPGTLYRTGDLGSKNAKGWVRYYGRKDNQVKIKGHRIELGEIEFFLRQYDGVAEAAVLPVETAGQMALIGFVVPSSAAGFEPLALRQYLKEHLPIYMLPAQLMPIDRFPLTLSGKLDRKQLIEHYQTLKTI